MPKRKKKPARKPRKKGLREPNGRLRRSSAPKADYGTPELLQRRTAAAMELGVGKHAEALSHPLDVLWRQGNLTEAQHASAMRYGRLYRICNGGPGLTSGASDYNHDPEELEELHSVFRKMQRRVLDAGAGLRELDNVCGLMHWPDWLVRGVKTSNDQIKRRRLFKAIDAIS